MWEAWRSWYDSSETATSSNITNCLYSCLLMGPTLGMITLHLTPHYLPDIMTAVTYNCQIEFDMFVRGKFCFKTNFPLKIPQSHHQFCNTCTCKLWNLRDPSLLLNKSFDLYASATCDLAAFRLQLHSCRVFLRCVEMSILPWTNNIMWYVSYTQPAN